MKLFYFRGHVPNFGDELNTWLWERLLPADFFDDDDSELFLGIGSILEDRLPKEPRKIVMGSGYAGYTGAPDMHDGSWEVGFVRGPLTARLLGLPREKAICDGAVLLRALDLPGPAKRRHDVAFMPHFESLDRGLWERACALAGIPIIDPREEVPSVIAQLRATRMLVTEAMHGAIVADALRIPWVAALPINRAHRLKWRDWAAALDLEVGPNELVPSNMFELYVAATKGRGSLSGRTGRISRSALFAPVNAVLVRRAAAHLRRLAEIEPQLSADSRIEEVTERALETLDRFVRKRAVSGRAFR
jgi:hypothetical protein